VAFRQLPALARSQEAYDRFSAATDLPLYLIRLYLSPSRTRFVTHHLVDLAVVVLPVLRPLRALRLLRLFTLSRAAVVLVNALTRVRGILTHRGLHFVLMGVTGIVVVGSGVELAFEQHAHGANIHDFGESLWWAIVTVTTVGYGGNYPVTTGGRCVAVVLMLVGIGLIGSLSATVASYFVEEKADEEKADLSRRLDRIEEMLAQALARQGKSG
jgi:voltage-gated potassium channel